MSADLVAAYRRVDSMLVARGFPPTSAWWLATLERFLASTCRELVIRAGRRAGKSSTLCRLAVVLALFGEWEIPPGDIGHAIFISARKDEAAARLHTIETILRALGVPFRRTGDAIDLDGRPIRFLVLPCTVAAASGPTAIMVVCDELAKWRDADTGANPATEVLAAVRPTTATQRNAKIVLSSSPVGTSDAHAEAFDRGDDGTQLVAHAPTWIANPTLAEDDTRKLERDPKVWAREYAAIPQAGATSAFDMADVDRAFLRIHADTTDLGAPIVLIDPAAGGADPFAWCSARWLEYAIEPREPRLRFEDFGSVSASQKAAAKTDAIVDRITGLARRIGAHTIVSDQYEAGALEALFRARGLHFKSLPWSSTNKAEAVRRVRRWLADRSIIFERDGNEQLRKEFAGFEERIGKNGITYSDRSREGHHFDRLALVLLAAEADERGQLRGSPLHPHEPYVSAIGRGSARGWRGLRGATETSTFVRPGVIRTGYARGRM